MCAVPKNGRFTVYEVVNESRREAYVGATHVPILEAFAAMAERLPPRVAHWQPLHERLRFRTLAFNLNEREALEFVAKYAGRELSDRKFLVERRALPRR